MDELFEQVQEVLGEHGRLQIETNVQTPDGQRIMVQWYRHGHCAKRMVTGLNLTEVFRKILLYEDDLDAAARTPDQGILGTCVPQPHEQSDEEFFAERNADAEAFANETARIAEAASREE
jgi:hypothetical protein